MSQPQCAYIGAGEGALRAPFEPPASRVPAGLAGERRAVAPLRPGGAPMRDRRTVRVHARVSPAELADWPAKAAAAGVPLSDLLRQAMARTRTWTAAAADAERERTRQVARIGNNLNELARWADRRRRLAGLRAQVPLDRDRVGAGGPADRRADRRRPRRVREDAWAGLEPDRYSWTAVLHRERGGGVHVHVLAARCDVETGRSLNIAPPGWRRTFDPLRDAFNDEHGWSRPDDPERARVQQPGHRAYIGAAKLRAGLEHEVDARELLRDYLEQRGASTAWCGTGRRGGHPGGGRP